VIAKLHTQWLRLACWQITVRSCDNANCGRLNTLPLMRCWD